MFYKKHSTLPEIKVSRNPEGFFSTPKPTSSKPLISTQHAHNLRDQTFKPRHNLNIAQEEKIETHSFLPPIAERKRSILKHSKTQNHLPILLNKKLESPKISPKFKKMMEFSKMSPEIDPLECLNPNIPFIDYAHSDSLRHKREEIMKLLKPDYEDQDDFYGEWLQDTEILYAFS